jgi:hypothetical protein
MLQNTLSVHPGDHVICFTGLPPRSSEGDADIAQATAIWPKVADEFNRYGTAP